MPEVLNIYRGTESVTAAKGASFVISLGAEVDQDSSVVLASSSIPSGTSRDFRHVVSTELEASVGATAGTYDQIRVRRNSAASAVTFDLEWTVIEFDPASLGANGVTSGRTTGFSAGGTISETIAVSDIDSAVCIVSWNTSSFSLAFSDGSVRAEITSTTNLDLIASGTFAGTMEVAWQVIDFDTADVAVQRGTVSVAAASGTTTATGTDTLGTAVDLGASLLVGNGANFPAVSSASAMRWAAGLELTDTTTVTAYLGGYGSESASKTLVMGYEVAEFLDGATVQAGTLAFGSGDSSKTTSTFSPALDADRTVAWPVHPNLGNVDTNSTNPGGTGAVSFRQALNITTDVDSLTAYRNVTGVAVDLTRWQVIEFASSAPATPSGTLAATTRRNTAAASGLVDSPFTFAATTRRNTAAASGIVGTPVLADLAATTRRSTLAANGTVDSPIALGATTRRNTLAMVGAAEARGALDSTTRRNTVAAAGFVGTPAAAVYKLVRRMRRAGPRGMSVGL